jgi:amino acid transporter
MENSAAKKFGTAPVFFTAISTILGAIMFLRFGFAVGNLGLAGTIAIIVIGHAVTIPTAMAIAEIATNSKVEGGGEYYIISRSFGLVIGSTIGVALYLSQAISVAFYIMAFTEAFTPLFDFLLIKYKFMPLAEWLLLQKQTVAIPALFVLTVIVLWKGAALGVKMLYFVVATLTVAMIAFFLGGPITETTAVITEAPVSNVSLFTVFAIIFPAFTGMTAGVGLSGDLKDPGRSIPLGTLSATLIGMIVYVFIAIKLDNSASSAALSDTSRLVMSDIAIQGWWLIPLGLAAATISSALGSILVAPRTLQAIARDNVIPSKFVNNWLSIGRGNSDEPFNATLVTVVLSIVFIMLGALNAVAEIISMFFMVTYGSLCLISFLQHFAGDPAYRPRFKSKWFISLFGAIACFGLMFFMNAAYAATSILFILGLYLIINYSNKDKKNMAIIFQGVIFQLTRRLHVFLQKTEKEDSKSWRPSAVSLSSSSFTRLDSFNLIRWISHRYGFGTYIHHIDGYLSKQSNEDARKQHRRLVKMADASGSKVYVDTLINNKFTHSIGTVIQLPSISGTENNLLIFENSANKPEEIAAIVDNFKIIKSANFDICILNLSEKQYGFMREIHVWITKNDLANANLMILMAYVISGHPDWRNGEIKVYSVVPAETMVEERKDFEELIRTGQLPISMNNVQFISRDSESDLRSLIKERSRDADLIILGFVEEAIKRFETSMFDGYEGLSNILFINTKEEKQIK